MSSAATPRARHGCLALAMLPLLAVAAPVTARRRRAAVRRRGRALIVSVRRRRWAGAAGLTCMLDIPAARWRETVDALAGVIADAAALVGRTVGCVGIVAGEEPILVALAPLRDLIAARATGALSSLEPHRYPQLWLSLPPGRYLAELVDPYAEFRFDEGWVLDRCRTGAVGHVLALTVRPTGVSDVVEIAAYASLSDLRRFLRLARRLLSELPDWRRAR